MRSNLLCVLTGCSAMLLAASPAIAHHFVPRESDTPTTIVGTVARFEMVNPHSRLFLDVREGTGEVSTWEIELGSIPALIARGWTRASLKPGDIVTVEAVLWRGRANAAVARTVEMPDGRRVFAGSHAGDYPRR